MVRMDAFLTRLLTLHPKRIDLSLDRMWRILDRLGHPERRLPPVIHVAGTNGKGSTVAFLRAIVEAAGRAVHVYTSPHLVRFNERIRLARPGGGALVEDDELADAFATCERLNAGDPITFFEITTAAAFLLFARHPADVLLLEVGLGGRLDATNVIERLLASVITPISLDHQDFLGNTIELIAAEKAGILKPNVLAVTAPQSREALTVIERQAARMRAPLRIAGKHWVVTPERGRMAYRDEHGLIDLPAPCLSGRHQFDNAGTAIATLRSIPALQIPHAAFKQGVAKVEWPARMQRLPHGRLVELAPQGSELWLDGGHNPDCGRAVVGALADLEKRGPRPLILIVGMLASKDCEGFLMNFAVLVCRVIAVPIQQDTALPSEEIAQVARCVGIPAETRDSVGDALATISALGLDPAPRILITGSLYLAGEVLAANGTLPI
ncbi:bifunctional folylpolyglutamate synthase/dihydrofolate synthase [Bradyrhizobium sp. SK17]|jgi:dihydrofolate synthase/folylpolyglutamate synthase|nr:folylpolyglutamate synthase/dihydrofolate synthase family protein [Bradyrhizobium sp. SK17]AUC94262.1 bifunctional folylpolyglutamate synthase/dihydrofolate synthase [Bradyrhizobium sp. SK17]KKC25935.1 folylpolyglutamate synthase [Sphingomonas sp. SRS2]